MHSRVAEVEVGQCHALMLPRARRVVLTLWMAFPKPGYQILTVQQLLESSSSAWIQE